MPSARLRDLVEVRGLLQEWLARQRPEAMQVSLSELRRAGDGLSCETVCFDVVSRDRYGTHTESLVARLPAGGDGLLPAHDLSIQYRVMAGLGFGSHIPVPRLRGLEPDPDLFGGAFYLMFRAEGHIPADDPPYQADGFVADASNEQQAALHCSFLDTLARIHRVDFEALGLDFVAGDVDEERVGSPIERDLEWWCRYVDWVDDSAAATTLRRALDWCAAHRPDPEPPPSLLWGDVRVPNVVLADDFTVAALLDWKLTRIGPAEVDLGWFLSLHGLTTELLGADLSGFLPRDRAVALYEESLGRTLDDLHWYEVYGAVRAAAIDLREDALLHDTAPVSEHRHRLEAARIAFVEDAVGPPPRTRSRHR